MRTRMESTTTILLAIATVICSVGMAPPSAVQAEAKMAAQITNTRGPVRGSVFKDHQGYVHSIWLVYYTDDHIEAIDFSVFSRLEIVLFLSGKMTSRSLVHLRNLPKGLQHLSFQSSLLDDRELPALLKRLPTLWNFELIGQPISEKSLAAIGNLNGLYGLNLKNTNTDDAGLKHLANLDRLGRLNLSGTKITDAGMREIAKLSFLGTLEIMDTIVTDEGIRELTGLEFLTRLRVERTKVTERGKESLKKLNPDLEFP